MNKKDLSDIFIFFAKKLALNENATLIYLQNKIVNQLDEKKQKARYIKRILQVLNDYCKNTINMQISSLQISEDIISIISRYNNIVLY